MLALPDVVFHLPGWCCGHFAEFLAASPRGFSAYVHGAEVFFVVGQPGERTTLLANVGFELTLGSVSLPEGQTRACPVKPTFLALAACEGQPDEHEPPSAARSNPQGLSSWQLPCRIALPWGLFPCCRCLPHLPHSERKVRLLHTCSWAPGSCDSFSQRALAEVSRSMVLLYF